MKNVFYSLILIVFISLPQQAIAQDSMLYKQTTRPSLAVRALEKNASGSAAKTGNQTGNLQTRGANEITRRITALQNLLTKLSQLKKLPASAQTTLSTQIQTEINSLNTLLAKIQANTDTVTLKTDVQSIVTEHRIFLLFMPQVRLLAAAEVLNTSAAKFTEFASKLQTRITQAETAGTDTAALETLLVDMQAKILDAQTQAAAITATVAPLTPAGYPGNAPTLQTARTNLQTGIKDLQAARADAQQIIQGFKGLPGVTPTSGTSSAVPAL